ncbi:hypothetical protein FB451DRAFT_728476 [Mycena latifolia]|nr:hypothetical protein FB451DRAFT_728476 [Mycena latifolia]
MVLLFIVLMIPFSALVPTNLAILDSPAIFSVHPYAAFLDIFRLIRARERRSIPAHLSACAQFIWMPEIPVNSISN